MRNDYWNLGATELKMFERSPQRRTPTPANAMLEIASFELTKVKHQARATGVFSVFIILDALLVVPVNWLSGLCVGLLAICGLLGVIHRYDGVAKMKTNNVIESFGTIRYHAPVLYDQSEA